MCGRLRGAVYPVIPPVEMTVMARKSVNSAQQLVVEQSKHLKEPSVSVLRKRAATPTTLPVAPATRVVRPAFYPQ